MPLSTARQTMKPRRSITAIIGGMILIAAAGFLFYTTIYQRPPREAPTNYRYAIKQGANTSVNYFDSSFFESRNQVSAAYITELADTINATFQYEYEASEAANLEYRYDVTATINALYASTDTEEDEDAKPTVWNRRFVLIEPTTEQVSGNTFKLTPSVEVPFQDYREQIEQLNTALSLSLGSEVDVQMTVLVRGEIDGQNFEDRKVAHVRAPLNQQLFAIESEYEREASGAVASGDAGFDVRQYIPELVTGLILIVGLVMLGYGLRTQIFRTPHQRELERIYRYHDGIIIRAKKRANLDGKNVVSVNSFDDILNIEEELKIPIVAAPNGVDSTQFIIVHGDVAYVYTLGQPSNAHAADAEASVERLLHSLEHRPKEKPAEPKPTQTEKPKVTKIPIHRPAVKTDDTPAQKPKPKRKIQ